MIRHLLQLIWNQRKQNAWLWAELLLVSVFLWFLVDYLYVMGRTYTAPLGFDIRHTYSIVISSLSERSPDYIPKEKRERPDGVHLLTALDRIRTYPGVESACLTDGGMPYYMGSRNLVWRIDTLQVPCRYAFVTPEFFDVFRIYDKDGKTASLKRAIEDKGSGSQSQRYAEQYRTEPYGFPTRAKGVPGECDRRDRGDDPWYQRPHPPS